MDDSMSARGQGQSPAARRALADELVQALPAGEALPVWMGHLGVVWWPRELLTGFLRQKVAEGRQAGRREDGAVYFRGTTGCLHEVLQTETELPRAAVGEQAGMSEGRSRSAARFTTPPEETPPAAARIGRREWAGRGPRRAQTHCAVTGGLLD